jgi:PHD/YefM family antitoxin component YafN of YafNO toxin-antitoxin module
MLIQDNFISTSELQQNVSKTIDRAKQDDIIVIRNNKLEAAIISIEKYNCFLEYVEWKKISEALDNMPIEQVSPEEATRVAGVPGSARRETRFTAEDIEKMAGGVDVDEL